MDDAQPRGRTRRVWTRTVAPCCGGEVFVSMAYLAEHGRMRVPHCEGHWILRLDPSRRECGEWPWIEWTPCETAQAVGT